jgi:hypothetical protein
LNILVGYLRDEVDGYQPIVRIYRRDKHIIYATYTRYTALNETALSSFSRTINNVGITINVVY